jgi:N-acetyltransferase
MPEIFVAWREPQAANRGGHCQPMTISAITLTGKYVRIEPLAPAHADDLCHAARSAEIWAHLPFEGLADPDRMRAWIDGKLAARATGEWLPFAIFDAASGRALGSSSYMEISTTDRRLEIGSTWLAREVWRTAVNTECKLLLLQHAFETLGCLRVQLKTDIRNARSQAAIERLGAVKEGILRAHLRRRDGTQRDTVMYSIVAAEWPAVKTRLSELLQRRGDYHKT